ncbi:GH3 domain-containing protein [Discoglossus pictus]
MLPFLFFALLLCGSLLLLVARWQGWADRVRRWRCLRVLANQEQRRILERETKEALSAQTRALHESLRELQNTEYGRKHHFKDMTDVSTFHKLHPLTTYTHYKDWIERVSRGEENILVPGRPLALVATAGTSGAPKAIPVTAHSAVERFLQGTALCLEVLHDHFPGALEKVFRFSSFLRPLRLSEAGIPVGPYPPAPASIFLRHLYCPQSPAHPTMSHHDTLYTQLLFALKDPELSALEAGLPWLLRQVFSLLESRWDSLARDIQLGRLCPDMKVPPDTRRQIEALLVPDAHRASEIRYQVEVGFHGIAKRVWPKLQVIITVASGGSELDSQILKDTVCQGVPIYSPMYCATEGLIGVNLWPDDPAPRYVLSPRFVFFEFIPATVIKEDQPATLSLQDVSEGEAYELVVTNRDGLIRYRLGDVVRVTGFHNKSPIVEFLYRKSQTLSVRGERISEDDFYRTLHHTVGLWPGAVLLNYCAVESGILGALSGGSDPHYEVFVALKGVRDLSEEQRYKVGLGIVVHPNEH